MEKSKLSKTYFFGRSIYCFHGNEIKISILIVRSAEQASILISNYGDHSASYMLSLMVNDDRNVDDDGDNCVITCGNTNFVNLDKVVLHRPLVHCDGVRKQPLSNMMSISVGDYCKHTHTHIDI